jgi:hypothetical protein
MITIFAKTSSSLNQKRQFFAKFFSENILKIITSVPGSKPLRSRERRLFEQGDQIGRLFSLGSLFENQRWSPIWAVVLFHVSSYVCIYFGKKAAPATIWVTFSQTHPVTLCLFSHPIRISGMASN